MASLGPKFSFGEDKEREGIFKYMLIFEKLKDEVNNFSRVTILQEL